MRSICSKSNKKEEVDLVQTESDYELVAVIAAALAANLRCLLKNKDKTIRRVNQNSTPWSVIVSKKQ